MVRSWLCLAILVVIISDGNYSVRAEEDVEEDVVALLEGSVVNVFVDQQNFKANDVNFIRKYEVLGRCEVTIQIQNQLGNLADDYFYFLQIHSLFYKMHMRSEDVEGDFETGTNLGVVFGYQNKTKKILVQNRHQNNTVQILIVLLIYSLKNTPLPGGCSLNSTSVKPQLGVTLLEDVIIVETEPASSEGFRSDFCLLDNPNLEYEFRYLYLGKNDFSGEAYFDSIQKLLTGKSAQENGLQFVGKIDSFNKLLKIYSRYAGMGLFFTTVALLTGNKSISIPISYIPGHSYGCPDEDVVPSCDLIENPESKVVYVLILLVGVGKLVFGRGMMFVRTLVYSFMTGGFVAFLICAKVEQHDLKMGIIAIGGIIFAFFWTLIWLQCHSVYKLSDLMAAMILGYIFSCLFIFCKADADFLIPTFNYYFIIICGITMVTVLYFSVITIYGVIVINAMVGATFVVLTLLFIFDGNLQYAFVDNWRRIRDDQFRNALVFPHMEFVDWICVVLWLVILCLGIEIQKRILVHYFSYGILQHENYYRGQRSLRIFRDPEQEPLIAAQRSVSSDDVFLSPRSNTRFMASISNRQH